MKLCEMHCRFQQYDHMMAMKPGTSTHHDKLSKPRNVQKMSATMPTPLRAGNTSQQLQRKNGRLDNGASFPCSAQRHPGRQGLIITGAVQAKRSSSLLKLFIAMQKSVLISSDKVAAKLFRASLINRAASPAWA